MAYQTIKTDVHKTASDDISLNDQYIETPRSAWWKNRSNSRFSTSLLFITFAAVTIIILMSLNLATLRATLHEQQILNAQHATDNVEKLPTTYSSDRRFMTLDTQYDPLWDEWTDDAQIMVPGDLPGEGLLQGAYSM
jgi:hypothetical protein